MTASMDSNKPFEYKTKLIQKACPQPHSWRMTYVILSFDRNNKRFQILKHRNNSLSV
jgi:hypothetical protein